MPFTYAMTTIPPDLETRGFELTTPVPATPRIAMDSTYADPTETLRAIFIQWPFASLIMSGIKTREIRKYSVRSKHNPGWRGDRLWLIESPGKGPIANKLALRSNNVPPRPQSSHVIGIVEFGDETTYQSWNAYDADRALHCINPSNDHHEWDGKGSHYGWHVIAIRPLQQYFERRTEITFPKPPHWKCTMIGCYTPNGLTVPSTEEAEISGAVVPSYPAAASPSRTCVAPR